MYAPYPENMMAVSYTHLDVYKRQDLDSEKASPIAIFFRRDFQQNNRKLS